MVDYVEIKFKGERSEVFENPMQFPFKKGDFAIVEAEKGIDVGLVNQFVDEISSDKEIKKILRKASSEDYLKLRQNHINEKKALVLCHSKVKKHKLDMQLVDCEYQFDGNKITFYFTSDQRVDFRELVKDLAAEYRTRIELRQIGVRDAARRMGGFGICGRKICCSLWIREFHPITTQAAKDQNLPLNPNRLAGVCGRLKCCLMYERDFYNWAISKFPELTKEIETDNGPGIIERIDILKETVLVRYNTGERETLPLAEIQSIYQCQNDCGLQPRNSEDLESQDIAI